MSQKGFNISREIGMTVQRNEVRTPKVKYTQAPRTLGELEPTKRRFIVSKIKSEKPKAYLLEIKGSLYWLPKSQVKIGIHPSGTTYAIDMPEWLAISNKLITR